MGANSIFINMIEILQYGFIQNAFLGGVMIALVCALIGVFLVPRRLSLLGDGIAHIAFGGIALGILFGINPIISAVIVALIFAFFIDKLITTKNIYADSLIAVFLSLGVGLGLIIISLKGGFNKDLFSYLFGSILTLSANDLILIAFLSIFTLAFFIYNYRSLLLITLNQDIAKTKGIKIGLINLGFMLCTAVAVVIGIRAVGIVLISALIVIPYLSASRISNSLINSTILASIIAVISVFIGIIASFYFNLPTGATIVVFLCMVFLSTLISRK